MDAAVLGEETIEAIRRRYITTQIEALCRSHEELRRLVAGLTERIAAQSELLSRRAEASANGEPVKHDA